MKETGIVELRLLLSTSAIRLAKVPSYRKRQNVTCATEIPRAHCSHCCVQCPISSKRFLVDLILPTKSCDRPPNLVALQ